MTWRAIGKARVVYTDAAEDCRVCSKTNAYHQSPLDVSTPPPPPKNVTSRIKHLTLLCHTHQTNHPYNKEITNHRGCSIAATRPNSFLAFPAITLPTESCIHATHIVGCLRTFSCGM